MLNDAVSLDKAINNNSTSFLEVIFIQAGLVVRVFVFMARYIFINLFYDALS
jgi:hypothetical protein